MIKSFKNVVAAGSILFMTTLAGSNAYAQFEPQFTQYMFNEMFINPAYAGSREHMAMTLLYRNQWVGMDGAPKTQTFTAHSPLRNERIGVGLNVMNEEIGITRDLTFFGNYSYKIPTNFGFISMGVSGGMIHHTERLSELNIQEGGDNSFIGTPQVAVPNAGFGTYLYSRNFYVGLSIPRMLQNKVDANTGKANNRMNIDYWHYYLTGGYVLPVNDNLKLKPTFMVKAVTGAPLIADVGVHALFHETFWLGASFRSGDSWAAITQFQINNQLRMGYSYDFTTTELKKYSSGTHEITLGYDFSFNKKKVVTPRYF